MGLRLAGISSSKMGMWHGITGMSTTPGTRLTSVAKGDPGCVFISSPAFAPEAQFRDRQEINWTIWGPSVPHIGSCPIERYHWRSCSTSRMSRLRSDPRWGAIGHSKVQVISCRSLTHRVSISSSGRLWPFLNREILNVERLRFRFRSIGHDQIRPKSERIIR